MHTATWTHIENKTYVLVYISFSPRYANTQFNIYIYTVKSAWKTTFRKLQFVIKDHTYAFLIAPRFSLACIYITPYIDVTCFFRSPVFRDHVVSTLPWVAVKDMFNYYTSLSFFLYKNMTVVLLFHPKINCMTIPPVEPVKNCRTIPPCGKFSNHTSRTFLIHSFHWLKLNDVMQVLGLFHCAS
jgi:hypothetical protein